MMWKWNKKFILDFLRLPQYFILSLNILQYFPHMLKAQKQITKSALTFNVKETLKMCIHSCIWCYFLPGFTGVITTLTSASTTTLMCTVHTTLAQSPTSVLSATFSTWWTMMATAPVTTQPRASNAGSATGLCHQMDHWNSQRSSSSSLLSH